MRSLAIKNGDLVLGPGGFIDVSGQEKVIQDLGIAVREPFGLDRFHKKYGTLLDRYVGRLVNGQTEQLIRSEITRVIQNYALIQQDQMSRDAINGFKPRYALSEIVTGVQAVNIRASFDSFLVAAVLRMASGASITISSSPVA